MRRNIVWLILFLVCSSYLLAQKNKKGNETVDEQKQLAIEELFIKANKQKIIGNLDDAKVLYEEVLKVDKQNSVTYFELARIAKMSNNNKEAEKLIREAIKIDDTNTFYNTFLAELLLDRRDYAGASAIYEKLIKIEPNNPAFYQNLSFTQIQSEKYDDAIKTLDRIEEQLGIIDEVSLQKQKLYLRLGKFDKALQEAEKLKKSDENNPRYYQNIVELYIMNNKFNEAKTVLEETLQRFPDDSYAIFGLAEMYRKQNDKDKLAEVLKKIFTNPKADIDGKISYLLPFIKDITEKNNYKDLALELSAILPKVHPNEAKAWAMNGDMLYQIDKKEEAVENYRQSLLRDSSIFTVWQQIAFIQNEMRNWNGLERDCTRAIELFPTHPIFYFFKGVAEQQQNKYEQALASYDKADMVNVDNNTLKAQILSSIAEIYNETKQYKKSDEKFEESLKYNPKNEYTLNNYAYYLSLRKEKLERAEEMSKLSNTISPRNPAFLDTYAWVLFQLGKYSEALDWQQKCLDNGGDNSPTNNEHMGDILYKLNRVDEAMKYWQRAKDKGSKEPLLLKKIEQKKYVE